jgi:hypothetical protein
VRSSSLSTLFIPRSDCEDGFDAEYSEVFSRVALARSRSFERLGLGSRGSLENLCLVRVKKLLYL